MVGVAKMMLKTGQRIDGVQQLTGVLTALSASWTSFADSSALDSRHNLRKTSTARKLSENLCSVLIKATTSERCRRLAFNRGLGSK